MNKSNKEIEYGIKIKNAKEIAELLKARASSQKTIKITRDIYKDGGKYFVKVSREKAEAKEQTVFSLKEDLLSQGISEGVKVAEEVNIPVSREQLESLVEIIKLLGFKLVSSFEKTRFEYTLDGLTVTIDKYADNDYLEVEGPSKRSVMALVKELPLKVAKDPEV